MKHLLVTNDFPPKVGGIQSYLWELWRRLPPEEAVVYTTAYEGAQAFDDEQAFRVHRSRSPFLGPTPITVAAVNRLAAEVDASIILLDPALPLGLIGPHLNRPYGVILHGAEVTVPGRLPATDRLLRRVLRGADLVVSAGGYPESEGERAAGRPLPSVNVPPGVDVDRFVPLDPEARLEARRRFDLPEAGALVVSVSRLVPRKGMDTLIGAAAALTDDHPDLTVAIAGSGRDERRLQRQAEAADAPVRFLGRVDDADLPALYGCGDVFAMLCRSRWFGLEQEGFGIVFLEAAACGVAQIAGQSGGAAEAVEHERTGLVVDDPGRAESVAAALDRLLVDSTRREAYGRAARQRAVDEFSYGVLVDRLQQALAAHG